jgi:hypothetical protein
MNSIVKIVLTAGALLSGVGAASGHYLYERYCCDGQDCAPYPKEKIEFRARGYYLPEFDAFISYDKCQGGTFANGQHCVLREPIDGDFHVCEYPKGSKTVRCFYPPTGGV